MASVSDICNMALSHIGSDTAVTSITPPDGSVEAGHCARFYPIARKEALEAHSWAFAKKRVALSPVTNESGTWGYAYAMPADCVTALRVLQASVVRAWSAPSVMTADQYQLFTERGSAEFEREGSVLYTHEPDAVLLYVRDVTDTTKFSTKFVVYLSYLLASYLAGPVIKGSEGATTAGRLRQISAVTLGEAAVADANGSSESADHLPDHIRGR
jgi:hypothetical protein